MGNTAGNKFTQVNCVRKFLCPVSDSCTRKRLCACSEIIEIRVKS